MKFKEQSDRYIFKKAYDDQNIPQNRFNEVKIECYAYINLSMRYKRITLNSSSFLDRNGRSTDVSM